MEIKKENFKYMTKCKGLMIGNYKITNNSNYIVFYNDKFIGELGSKRDVIDFIDNLVKYQKLEYTEDRY